MSNQLPLPYRANAVAHSKLGPNAFRRRMIFAEHALILSPLAITVGLMVYSVASYTSGSGRQAVMWAGEAMQRSLVVPLGVAVALLVLDAFRPSKVSLFLISVALFGRRWREAGAMRIGRIALVYKSVWVLCFTAANANFFSRDLEFVRRTSPVISVVCAVLALAIAGCAMAMRAYKPQQLAREGGEAGNGGTKRGHH